MSGPGHPSQTLRILVSIVLIFPRRLTTTGEQRAADSPPNGSQSFGADSPPRGSQSGTQRQSVRDSTHQKESGIQQIKSRDSASEKQGFAHFKSRDLPLKSRDLQKTEAGICRDLKQVLSRG